MMKSLVEDLLHTALSAVNTESADLAKVLITVERTRDPAHGEFATNLAMQLAKPLRKSPRDIAALLVDALPDSEWITKTEIAGPGFINFYLADAALHKELLTIKAQGDSYGSNQSGAGKKVLVEFVSANPTGPLHVGHVVMPPSVPVSQTCLRPTAIRFTKSIT